MRKLYLEESKKKSLYFFLLLAIFVALTLLSLCRGQYQISFSEVLDVFFGSKEGPPAIVLLQIRLPRIIAATLCGLGLALSGLAIQSLLKNPLASPATLGISQGAAFGTAASILIFGAKPIYTTLSAFIAALSSSLIILALAGRRRLSPESIILAGVALAALFSSATILCQYLASETELAMVVFWTFGDVARSGYSELSILAMALLPSALYLFVKRWQLNATALGEESALSLGVDLERFRILGVFLASLLCALVTAFHGVIAFVGLIAPHLARKLVGHDHRLLLPLASLSGALLLLLADTLARLAIGSGALPVGVITSFLGTPTFLLILLRGRR